MAAGNVSSLPQIFRQPLKGTGLLSSGEENFFVRDFVILVVIFASLFFSSVPAKIFFFFFFVRVFVVLVAFVRRFFSFLLLSFAG